MCYALPGPRCTPQAYDKFARWSEKVDRYQEKHPHWGPGYPVNKRYQTIVDHYMRYTSDYWACPEGIAKIRESGERVRAKAILAKRRGDLEVYKTLYARTIELHNQYVDLVERRNAAHAAANARRRALYATYNQRSPLTTSDTTTEGN